MPPAQPVSRPPVAAETAPPTAASGLVGARETSGVQVRLGSRSERHLRARESRQGTAGRRSGIVAAGVLALAALVTGGLVLTSGPGDEEGGGTTAAGGTDAGAPAGRLPRGGTPIEVGTADGARYRIAAVTGGVNDGVAPTLQSSPPTGTSFAYIEYVLTNPTKQQVLLDFPGDVFVRRNLVTPDARGRCMPQAGVPEDMCTPPTRSEVVRTLSGGRPVDGDGGDKYMPAGASYLVRATVDVPVQKTLTSSDMGLYVWKQLYMADRLAKRAPFPKG
ncbi:hypothetical protein [Spirillospora albida]|uniref:hypothetical protein n=1 Tax=Spirillospora albida TaxID=58123 RepID=UPI00068EC9BF|nr:hypothetical protein [Spirillospora albida]